MNSNTILRSWNGRTIRQREDGYINATDMCQACNKQWYEFSRSKFCTEYLDSLESITEKSRDTLIETQVGNSENAGTWIHRKLAIRLAQWLSTDFAVIVDGWVEELLLKGYVSIQNQPRISSDDDKEIELLKLGIDLAKTIKDERALIVYSTQLSNLLERIQSKLTPKTQELLPAPIWLSATEVLSNHGYSLNRKEIQDSLGQVGKLVKASYLLETGEEPKITTKLVGTNHKAKEIKLYPESFFTRICEIACDYWERKNILM